MRRTSVIREVITADKFPQGSGERRGELATLPDWAWFGRDRAHVWHVLRRVELDDGSFDTFCGKPALNARSGIRLSKNATVCRECSRLVNRGRP